MKMLEKVGSGEYQGDGAGEYKWMQIRMHFDLMEIFVSPLIVELLS